MIRASGVLLSFLVVASAHAGDDQALRTSRFAYPPSVVGELGPAIHPNASIPPPVDRSRAYLLEISEDEINKRPAIAIRNTWDRIRSGLALPALKGNLVAEREDWYRRRKDLVEAISQKARRYLYYIVEAVEKRGLPTELALLPFVESGFEPQARSSAQAVGLWQFIPATAQRYRLKQNHDYDARHDIVASTEAALDYLEFLHGIFQDWHLALAAYNWGEEAVLKAVQRNQSRALATDYESLVMPEETRYYVPKLMAIRNIVEHPENYGIELADIDNAPYFTRVDVSVELDAHAVAGMAGLSVAEVLALNPSHKTRYISGRGRPAILLPTERTDEFVRRLSALSVKHKATGKRDTDGKSRKAIVGFRNAEGRAL